ncbi:hypothetical protein [Natronoglycomyces albus]|uniref:Uncharacterized protein n=1 Tax=Natronoglycomyces albus TaxID=2811108 RepID=A0A895XV68_9ACTN|nr:hypothetical protein [Natronoglycomyces albus]QSB05538.1 hypothetical protein JQS30_00935 [Natronoglycomyces albus]
MAYSNPHQPHPQQPGYPQQGHSQPGGYPQAGHQQPGYPQPGYQQPGYQQPGYPPPGYSPPPPQPKGSGGTVVLVVVLLLLVGGGGVGAWWYFGQDGEDSSVVADDATDHEEEGQADLDDSPRLEDVEAGLTYVERDGWEFHDGDDLLEEFSSLYIVDGGTGTNNSAAIYGVWGPTGAGTDLRSETEATIHNNGIFFVPSGVVDRELESGPSTVGSLEAYDISQVITHDEGPDIYIRVLLTEHEGKLRGLIGLSDYSDMNLTDELNEIMDSMQVLGAD